jgi:hypothetical protein
MNESIYLMLWKEFTSITCSWEFALKRDKTGMRRVSRLLKKQLESISRIELLMFCEQLSFISV